MWAALRYASLVVIFVDRAISSGLCVKRNDTCRFRRFAHLSCMQFYVILRHSCDMLMRDLYKGNVHPHLIVSGYVFIWLFMM